MMKKIKVRRTRGITGAALSLVMLAAGLALIGYALTGGHSPASAETPESTALKLTVPKMARVDDVPVYDASSSDAASLDKGALHVRETGFPWQTGANVYIAGHRLGYAGTGSFLLFYDLNKLQNGDRVILTDTNGTRYVYKVFREFTVAPSDLHVTRPVAGKSVVSLQTCTLPDYSKRLIVQAKLVSVNPAKS